MFTWGTLRSPDTGLGEENTWGCRCFYCFLPFCFGYLWGGVVWDGSSAAVLALPVAPSCISYQPQLFPSSRQCRHDPGHRTAEGARRKRRWCRPAPHPPGAAGGCRRAQRVRRPLAPPPAPPARGDPRAQGKPRAGRPPPAPVPPPPGGPGLPLRAALGPPRTAHEREPGEPVRGAAAAAAVHSLRSRRRRGEAWRTPTW